jgi:hypothetical protein
VQAPPTNKSVKRALSDSLVVMPGWALGIQWP